MIKLLAVLRGESSFVGAPGRMRTLRESNSMRQTQQIIIIVLAVAVVVLGYLYYQRSRNDIVIQIPNIQINP
jgi:uncharacterized membrane protein YidH (DUF202 family)